MSVQHSQKMTLRHPYMKVCLSAVLAFAGTAVWANHIHIGGFTNNTPGESVAFVAPDALPAWQGLQGARLELSGTFHQTAPGEASIILRLFDPEQPLILAWHGAEGFQLVPPAGLPQNIPATPAQSNPQTIEWRLRVTSMESATHRVHLDVRQLDGSWQPLLKLEHIPLAVQEWYEAGAVSLVGIAGPAAMAGMNARFTRAGTLLILK